MRSVTAIQTIALTAALTLGSWVSAQAGCNGNCAAWEAVEEYNGTNPDLPATIAEGQKFESAVAKWGNSWKTDFRWTDDSAWERDFKTPGWKP